MLNDVMLADAAGVCYTDLVLVIFLVKMTAQGFFVTDIVDCYHVAISWS